MSATSISGCDRLYNALRECHARVPSARARESACRHLNRALAECLISQACPHEAEAVRSLCASGGTALKRAQCREAQVNLAVCMSVHQQEG